ncbi:hypothetical protein FQN53_006001 [Emmonsiellopsis sp. PD_33]|nr:hypothetical protein FQN53_006001 [Emmonsiellopsis sp. PD_33]
MSFTSLPTELIAEIVSHVPVLDYRSLKLAGCRRTTDVIRHICSSLPRSEYLAEIHREDAKGRCAMEILIEHGRLELVAHFGRKYKSHASFWNYPFPMPEYNARAAFLFAWRQRRSFRTAIHWAAYYRSKEALGFMKDHIHYRGGKYGWTALHYAAMRGWLDVVDILLRNGAYVNALDDLGRTPLKISIDQGASTVAATLRAQGGKMDVRDVIESCEESWVQLYLDRHSKWIEFNKVEEQYLSLKLLKRFSALWAYSTYRYCKSLGERAQFLTETKENAARLALLTGFPSILFVTLNDGMDINAPIPSLRGTPLHVAVKENNPLMIRKLLEHGADQNSTQVDYKRYGHRDITPFDMANKLGHKSAIEVFLEYGVCVDSKNSQGETGLRIAAQGHDESLVDFFLQHGADVRITDIDENTPLHIAAQNQRSIAVESLIMAGAEIEARNSNGQTPLAMACAYCPTDVEYIEAAQQVVRTLLAAGASMRSQDNEGVTPFQRATRDLGYSAGNVRVLVEHGADIHERDAAGRTALHHALSGSSITDIATIIYLVEQGVDVNAIANDGVRPLHLAMRWQGSLRGNPPLYKFLLWNGADPNARDPKGRVALQLSWDVDVWKSLLQTGARVDERDADGRTTLLRLLSKPYDDYFDGRKRLSHTTLLLAYGADANAQDNNRYTPLMYAVQNPVVADPGLNRYILWILMHFGADPRIKNPQGRAALDLCANPDIKKTLSALCTTPPPLNPQNKIFHPKPEEELEDLLYLLGRLALPENRNSTQSKDPAFNRAFLLLRHNMLCNIPLPCQKNHKPTIFRLRGITISPPYLLALRMNSSTFAAVAALTAAFSGAEASNVATVETTAAPLGKEEVQSTRCIPLDGE